MNDRIYYNNTTATTTISFAICFTLQEYYKNIGF